MNLPAHITRAQLTEAFKALGLDIAEVQSIGHSADFDWVHVDMRGTHPNVEAVVVKIPIVEVAPQPAGDPLGEIGKEARG